MAERSFSAALKKNMLRDQRVLLAIVIVVIIAIISIINPVFLSVGNLIIILQQISVLGILTLAMSMLLISGGIDLAIGNIMVLSGVVMYLCLQAGVALPFAILAGFAVGTLCGLINGAIVSYGKSIPLVITLGMGKVYYGIALTFSGGRIMNFRGAFNGLKTRFAEVLTPMIFVLLFMTLITFIIMNYTKFGRRLVAIGGNEKNAYLSGIKVNRYKMLIYALSGLFCAIACIVFVARVDSITSNAGANYETNALAASIIGGVTFEGGKGTVGGAFLGCLLMGVLANAMNILGVDTNIQTVVTGLIIVGAVVVSNLDKIRR